MNNTFGVSGLEGVGSLDSNGQQFFDGEGMVGHGLTEGLSFEQLHDEEVLSAQLLDGVNGADVGVIQGRGGASLALETLDGLAVLGQGVGQELEGDTPAETGIFGFVDHAHAATSQFSKDFVMGNGLSDEGIRNGHRGLILDWGSRAGQGGASITDFGDVEGGRMLA